MKGKYATYILKTIQNSIQLADLLKINKIEYSYATENLAHLVLIIIQKTKVSVGTQRFDFHV